MIKIMQPKKSLGQNFLQDKQILSRIIEVADLKTDDFVIEIGPGEGVLTEKLLETARKVIAIEIDQSLSEKLKKRFANKENFELINGDILKINLPRLIEEQKLESDGYKVIANIPYYITSPIIRIFLETKYPPKEMILMVQKEVAERICAVSGQMSLLSASVQYYAKPELLFYVDKKAFYPIPEVDSAVIRITHNLKHLTREENKRFFRILRTGFSAKRKTLSNNLSASLKIDKKVTEGILKEAGIAPNARAQELSVENWKKLFRLF